MLRRKLFALIPAWFLAPFAQAESKPTTPRVPDGDLYHTSPEPFLLRGYAGKEAWYEPLPDGRWGTRRMGFWVMFVGGWPIISPFDYDVAGAKEAAKVQLAYALHGHMLQSCTSGRVYAEQEYGVSLVLFLGSTLPKPLSWAPKDWYPGRRNVKSK